MKLIRFGEKGAERPGVLFDGVRKDCSQFFPDWNPEFFQQDGLNALRKLLQQKGDQLPTVSDQIRHAACVARPYMTICVGLNYKDHAQEVGATLPQEPNIFTKSTRAIIGPYDDIMLPKNSKKTDWEIELALVINKDAAYLKNREAAKAYVAGFTLANDVSERAFQNEHAGERVKGKSCDTFNPVGPYLLTPDEMGDPNQLEMILTVNGHVRQKSNTNNMIFDSYFLVYYISQFMTLEAGTLLLTGTPSGVGAGMKPPQFLQPNDVVELQLEKLGMQRNRVVAYQSS